MEPVYSYKKGEGWVLDAPYDSWEVEDRGYKLRFEHRRPEIGERFYYLYLGSQSVCNGRVNFRDVFAGMRKWTHPPEYNSALLIEENEKQSCWQFGNKDYTHIVLSVTKCA